MDSNIKKIKILDCTLRDGSYENNFKFTAEDTKEISSNLEKLGFEYIEVGHGVGLGASVTTKYKAVATDEEYMIAANSAVNNSKWGMFCIPGVSSLDDIKLAVDNEIDFIRIGVDPSKISNAQDFIQLASRLGVEVFVNFMKSHTVSPKFFVQNAAKAIEYGAKMIYLVDSAGSMLPDEIKAYVNEFNEKFPNVELGFHGHNNLGLAVYNSLLCVQENVKIIDTTLQGFGRSAGNTPAESFISVLNRYGIDSGINYIDLMNYSENSIRPFIKSKGLDTLDVVSGYSGFHSSYMPLILEAASKYSIDPKELIIDICKVTQTDLPLELLNEVAMSLNKVSDDKAIRYAKYYGEEQSLPKFYEK
tara:strand:+ start:1238 stop:2320 length:1083 start_codon:yes stop_codon:yes gene_type:complete